jgi:serine/threonine-protein phosphatase PGAM5
MKQPWSHAMPKPSNCQRLIPALLILLLGAYAPVHAAATDSGKAAARTVYLIRHGAYVADPKADPALGPGITPLGIAQARLVAVRLKGMPVHFDSMVSSTLTRARETAAVMHETLADVPLSASPLLSECTPPASGELHGSNVSEQAQCAQRLDSAAATFLVPAKGTERNDVLVAHGNVIRYLVMKALNVDSRTWPVMSVAHASVTILRVRPDGSMTVLGVGDIGHVPPNLQSWGGPTDSQLLVRP